MPNKAVFLDRDGVVNEEMGYINHVSRFVVFPFVPQAIKHLRDNGFKVVLITNQAGVAKGYFPESLLKKLHGQLQQFLKKHGTCLDGIYYCPHHPQATVAQYRKDCPCRKPKPGLVLRAASELGIDLKKSYVVGDRFTDIELAHRVGARSVLVLTGYGQGEWQYIAPKHPLRPDFVAQDLLDAAKWIVKDANSYSQT